MACLIPIFSAILYLLGGQVNKWFRWIGIGLFISVVHHSFLPIMAYYIAISGFPYGEKSWLNFLGEYGKFFVVGFALGACSFILLPFGLALSQSLFSGISFVVIKYFDDKNIIKNPFVELLRGGCGVIFLIFK